MLEKKLGFFRTYMKDPQVASIIPSSKFSVKKVCKKIDFSERIVVVEYGPGNGVFTRYMLRHMTSDSRLIAIETNKAFADCLRRICDQRLEVFHSNAENVEDIMEQCNEGSADYVISGVPFSRFKPDEKRGLIGKTYHLLQEGGKFLVYQCRYSAMKYLKEYFDDIDLGLSVLNIPPLVIFEAVK